MTQRRETERHLRRIAKECDFGTLADLAPERFERWLATLVDAGAASRTRNTHRDDLVTFANWCKDSGRLLDNPFAKVCKLNVDSDRRHRQER